jgi:hypothetical protein
MTGLIILYCRSLHIHDSSLLEYSRPEKEKDEYRDAVDEKMTAEHEQGTFETCGYDGRERDPYRSGADED